MILRSVKFLSFAVIVLIPHLQSVQAQVIEGQVFDQKSGEPLAYVNIGVVELGVGAVSDKTGNFKLRIEDGQADSVMFSAIGYTVTRVAISELLENPEVQLAPKSYELESFDVVEKTRGRDKVYGREKGLPHGFTNLAGNLPGDEIGAHIRIKRQTYLKSANFNIYKISGDSMLYRVNIYEFREGKAGQNLLTENVLIEDVQDEGVVTVDLTPYELVVNQDVLLTLENIKVDADSAGKGMRFRYAHDWIGNGNLNVRRGENSKNVDGEFSKILDKAELNFFFVGRRLR